MTNVASRFAQLQSSTGELGGAGGFVGAAGLLAALRFTPLTGLFSVISLALGAGINADSTRGGGAE